MRFDATFIPNNDRQFYGSKLSLKIYEKVMESKKLVKEIKD